MFTDAKVAIWRSTLLPASETFVRSQANALTRWQPTLVGAIKVRSTIADDSDVIAFPDGARGRRAFHRLRLTGGSSRLRAVLMDIRPDIVHAHFGGDGWLISRSAVQLGIPLIITLHGRDVTVQPRARGVRGARYRRNLQTAFARSAVILAVSDAIRARAIDLGADPAKVRVHHTGVPIPDAPTASAKTWDIAYVGRFIDKKGIDDLIEAVGMIGPIRPRVVLIGDGPLSASLRDRAQRLGDRRLISRCARAVGCRGMRRGVENLRGAVENGSQRRRRGTADHHPGSGQPRPSDGIDGSQRHPGSGRTRADRHSVRRERAVGTRRRHPSAARRR